MSMKVYEPGELADVAGNKYMGTLVAAKYARELNALPLGRSPYGGTKLTSVPLDALTSGQIDFPIVDRLRSGRD
jgi:DNA-directed RNA polymerase subunit K/omega